MATEDPTGWREFIENVIDAQNYFRVSDYMRLLEDMEDNVRRIRDLELKLATMTKWLEANQPDVFKRGIWDALAESDAEVRKP